MRPDKKIAWHPDIDVLWRENAWADTTVSINWVNTTLKPVVENLEKHVLFVDNLTAQQTDDFKKAVSDLKGVVWYELKNASDLCQVVDAGISHTLKVLTRRNYWKWLDKEYNVNIWFGDQTGLTANGRRILITQWVRYAWQELCSSKYHHLKKRYWEKTGCLITADGSEDVKITPEGLADYKVPLPLSYLPACEAAPISNTPDTTENNEEKQEEETLDEDLEKPENDGTEFEDGENDRS